MTSRNRAFTLIELLVVIAIIAILAAILFPVFAQAKKSAKKASDLSNIKQIDLASIMYSTDSDDILPANGEGLADQYARNNWDTMTPWTGQQNFYGTNYGAGAYAPLGFMDDNAVQNWARSSVAYVKSMDLFVSPGSPNDADSNFAPVPNTPNAGRTSYVFNGCASRVSQTSVALPADVVFFQNRATTTREALCMPRRNYFTDGAKHANDADVSWVGFNFSKGANYGWGDGHAKFVKRNALKFKNLGYFEWVDTSKGWQNPASNPTMESDPDLGLNYWGTWGQCDVTQTPWN